MKTFRNSFEVDFAPFFSLFYLIKIEKSKNIQENPLLLNKLAANIYFSNCLA